jgi:hypothetical protein
MVDRLSALREKGVQICAPFSKTETSDRFQADFG